MAIRNKWPALALTLVGAAAAAQPCIDLSRPACVRSQLETEDRTLNSLYAQLMERATPSEADQLRSEQRQWLRDRNATCSLTPGSTNQNDWIAVLADDPGKALCVYGSTHARLEQLRSRSPQNMRFTDEVLLRNEYSFPVSRNKGKWYAEMRFLAANYGTDERQYMQVGAANTRGMLGMQVFRSEMRRQAGANGEYVVGIALDLDNSKLYWSENGDWRSGAPGSAEGVDLVFGDGYALRIISAAASISNDLNLGFIDVNTGREPFLYAMPAGFQPYFAPTDASAGASLDWIVPSYKQVAGLSLPQWAERYWAWLLPKSPERHPTQDLTGAYCADGQSGPVWFLSGADARSNITRACRVPKDKFVLLPVVVQSLIPKEDSGDICARFDDGVAAKDGSDAINPAYIVLDGQRFDALYDFHVFTPRCAPIRGALGETVVPAAVHYGVFVMLQPLPPGEHTITFGGELRAMNGYRNVTYRLTVN